MTTVIRLDRDSVPEELKNEMYEPEEVQEMMLNDHTIVEDSRVFIPSKVFDRPFMVVLTTLCIVLFIPLIIFAWDRCTHVSWWNPTTCKVLRSQSNVISMCDPLPPHHAWCKTTRLTTWSVEYMTDDGMKRTGTIAFEGERGNWGNDRTIYSSGASYPCLYYAQDYEQVKWGYYFISDIVTYVLIWIAVFIFGIITALSVAMTTMLFFTGMKSPEEEDKKEK
jgi:hypothetical protein